MTSPVTFRCRLGLLCQTPQPGARPLVVTGWRPRSRGRGPASWFRAEASPVPGGGRQTLAHGGSSPLTSSPPRRPTTLGLGLRRVNLGTNVWPTARASLRGRVSHRQCPWKGAGSGSALTPRGRAVSSQVAGRRAGGATANPCAPGRRLSLRLSVTTHGPSATDGRGRAAGGHRAGPGCSPTTSPAAPPEPRLQTAGNRRRASFSETRATSPRARGGRGSRAGTVLSPRRRCRSTTELVTAAPPPALTRAHSRGASPQAHGPRGEGGRVPPSPHACAPSENPSRGHCAQRAHLCETAGPLEVPGCEATGPPRPSPGLVPHQPRGSNATRAAQTSLHASSRQLPARLKAGQGPWQLSPQPAARTYPGSGP